MGQSPCAEPDWKDCRHLVSDNPTYHSQSGRVAEMRAFARKHVLNFSATVTPELCPAANRSPLEKRTDLPACNMALGNGER